MVLAVGWPVKYCFVPVFPEKWWRKEEEERQLRSILLFKQTQKVPGTSF